jgi:hypothetical protein
MLDRDDDTHNINNNENKKSGIQPTQRQQQDENQDRIDRWSFVTRNLTLAILKEEIVAQIL